MSVDESVHDVGVLAAIAQATEAVGTSDTKRRVTADEVLSALGHAVVVVGNDGTIELMNDAACDLLGMASEFAVGLSVDDLAVSFPDSGESPIEASLTSGVGVDDVTAVVETPQGRRWLMCSCRPFDRHPSWSVLVSLVDITDRYHEFLRNRWRATHDSLTGLLDRSGLIDAIDTQISDLVDPSELLAVYHVAVESVRLANPSSSRSLGAEIASAVANRLQTSVVWPADLARIARDEFAVATPVRDEAMIRSQTDRIRASFNRPLVVGDDKALVSISVGVATAGVGRPLTGTELLAEATRAPHPATFSTHARYVGFETRFREDVRRRKSIETELRHVLNTEPQQLYLNYQPIVDCRRGKLVGAEALVRWKSSDLGQVSPAEFIPIAEQSDLVQQVGGHILRTSLTEFADKFGTDSPIMLCVNFSRCEIADPEFLTRLDDILAETGVYPSNLCVEITEGELVECNSDLTTTLSAVRALGVHVALDDFGTGASSLSDLIRLPVSLVKIAKPFIDALDNGIDPYRAQVILHSIVDMAHAAGMQVIAEGVETERQCQIVEQVGADFVQGFLYGRPGLLDDLDVEMPSAS